MCVCVYVCMCVCVRACVGEVCVCMHVWEGVVNAWININWFTTCILTGHRVECFTWHCDIIPQTRK